MSKTTETSWVWWVRTGCIIVIPFWLVILGLFSVMEAVPPHEGPGLSGPTETSLGLILAVALLAAVLAALLVARNDWAGNSAAVLVVVGAGVLVVIAPPRVEKWSRKLPPTEVCLYNLVTLSTAWSMYALDHDEQLPPAEYWPQSLLPYGALSAHNSVLLCPADIRPLQQKSDELATSYTMSDAFGGIHEEAIKDAHQAGVFFDGTKLHGRHEAADFRHGGLGLLRRKPGTNIAYADGHCEYVRQDDFLTVRLEP